MVVGGQKECVERRRQEKSLNLFFVLKDSQAKESI